MLILLRSHIMVIFLKNSHLYMLEVHTKELWWKDYRVWGLLWSNSEKKVGSESRWIKMPKMLIIVGRVMRTWRAYSTVLSTVCLEFSIMKYLLKKEHLEIKKELSEIQNMMAKIKTLIGLENR